MSLTPALQNSSLGASGSRDPWSECAEKMAQATTLYTRYMPLNDQAALISYLYISCILKHSHMLFSIWSGKGWGPMAFMTMLNSGTLPYTPPTLMKGSSRTAGRLDSLTLASAVTRSEISTVLSQCHGPWLLHLAARERIAVLQSMARLFSHIGYKRKEAIILREITSFIMDLIVCGRDESEGTKPKGPAGLGIQDLAVEDIFFDQGVGIRETESTAGNQGILKVVRYVCEVHGIDMGYQEEETEESQSENEVDSDPNHTSGWPELQVGIVREALAIAEALPGLLDSPPLS